MSLIEAIVLGIAQGITEWIPISSEGVTVFLGVYFFDGITLTELIRLSLYLHLGTFLAALVYFRQDILILLRQLVAYPKVDISTKAVLNFYVLTTLISGVIGFTVLKAVEGLEGNLEFTSQTIVTLLGALLLITGLVQLKKKKDNQRDESQANVVDAILTGIAQGISVLPGFSRSGMTVATLLLRGFDDTKSLQMSFILSLPIVLMGNILLNAINFAFTGELFVAVALSFLIGLASIHFLLRFAKRVRFGYFVLFFGTLVIASTFI